MYLSIYIRVRKRVPCERLRTGSLRSIEFLLRGTTGMGCRAPRRRAVEFSGNDGQQHASWKIQGGRRTAGGEAILAPECSPSVRNDLGRRRGGPECSKHDSQHYTFRKFQNRVTGFVDLAYIYIYIRFSEI